MVQRLRWLSSSSSSLPSGDQAGAEKNAFEGSGIARGLVTPVCSPIISWYSPLASESHAMLGAVGRPHRVAIVHAGARREVPIAALLGRQRGDVAARFERRAHAGRRERRAADHAGDLLELGRAHGKSAVTSIVSRCDLRVAVSTRWM